MLTGYNRLKQTLSRLLNFSSMVASALLFANPAFSQSGNPALDRCRETVGRPIVMPCMKAGGNLESCRALATPKVKACVQAAMGNKGGGQGSAPAKDQNRSTAGPAVGRARSLIEQGKFVPAIAELDQAVRQDPKYAYAFAWRGAAKIRMGRHEEAIPDLNEALRLDPRNTFALAQRGYAFYNLKDNGRALTDLNAAGDMDASSPAPYGFRGLVYSDMGDQERALSELNKALKLKPDFALAHGGLGAVYNKQQEYEKALLAYDKALALSPKTGPALGGRGFTYLNLGEYDRAITDLSEALRLAPGSLKPLINRGRAYIALGNFPAAISDLDEALKVEANNVAALLQRAQAFERSRELQKARTDLESVLRLVPSHPVATAGVERISVKLGAARPVGERTGGRIALVIGNSKYENFDSLPNPKRDASLMAEALGKSGFQNVKLLTDVNRDALSQALRSFADDSRNANWAVVYYAGHGIELEGSNYLVPVDANFEKDADIPNEGVALDQILNAVSAADKMRLVVLDACREHPFLTERKSLSVGRGLARIEPESGTLVAFATKHGHLATDGAGDNSPFTTSLVQRMDAPGLEISQLFRLVHDDVYASTGKRQEPFTYGQLSAESFYFKAR